MSETQIPLEPYQQRLLIEKREVETRLVALQNFIDSPSFPVLPDMDQHLMNRQAHFMSGYLGILLQRIARFQNFSVSSNQVGG